MSKIFLLLLFIIFLIQETKSQIVYAFPPGDTAVCSGSIAVFIVTVSAGLDSIRWQYASNSSGPWDTLINGVSGDKTTKLQVINLQFYNEKFFRAVAIDGGMLVDSSMSASLTVWDSPVPIINPPSLTLCQGVSDTLDVGTGYMTYLWNTGSIAHSVNVPSGLYSVTVTEEHGCTGSTSMMVNDYPPIGPIVFTPPIPKFCTMGDTTVTLGTELAYDKYYWSNDSTSHTIQISHIGPVGLTVTDANGCTAVNNINVSTYTPPLVEISSPTTEFCEGGSTVLTATPGNYEYVWSETSTTQSITVYTEETYTVSVTDKINGCQASSSSEIVVHDNPFSNFIMETDPPDTIRETQQILFTDTSRPAVDTAIMQWKWRFGSEALAPDSIYNFPGNSTTVSYNKSGNKRVCLDVIDHNTCFDDSCKEFRVYDLEGPLVQLSELVSAKCIGDITILKARITNQNPIIYRLLEMSSWTFDPPIDTSRYTINNSPFNPDEWSVEARVNFPDTGKYTVSVTGYQEKKVGGDVSSGKDIDTVRAGEYVPQLASYIIPPFICQGDIAIIELYLTPAVDAMIIYNKNEEPTNSQGMAIDGYFEIQIPSGQNENQIRFKVLSIETENECKNSDPGLDTVIEIRDRPVLHFDNPDEVCVGSNDTVYVTGAETYIWKLEGIEVSTDSFLHIPTDEAGPLLYSITGDSAGCSSDANITVQVKDPPIPTISGDDSVCIGQHVTYESNSIDGIYFWKPTNGEVQGPNNEIKVEVKWFETGSLKLIQEEGGCKDSTFINVEVGKKKSPPDGDLVYLKGGGILLYPNPDTISGLCYEWYKDGMKLQDTFQGCVVGTNLSESELKKYSVIVYYCGQSTECGQLITRAIQEVSKPTEFNILVVPNPNSGDFSLHYDILDAGNYVQYIFNSSGQLIGKESIDLEEKKGSLNLSLSNVVSGLYFIKLINSITGDYRVVPVSIFK